MLFLALGIDLPCGGVYSAAGRLHHPNDQGEQVQQLQSHAQILDRIHHWPDQCGAVLDQRHSGQTIVSALGSISGISLNGNIYIWC